MFCSLCCNYDIKQNNGQKTWNAIANVRCRTQTVIDHFKMETSMHQEAVRASVQQKTSYFDLEEKKKVTALKNDVYYKVLCSFYWVAKEQMPSSKIASLLTLLEKMGVREMKYFETRSEPILRKMLLLIARTIIQDLVNNIRKSNFYALLTDEVTDISNICQLVSFVKFFDVDKGRTDTAFLDCSDLLQHSIDASPNADAIFTCFTKKMQELAMEIGNLRAFVSDGASLMTGDDYKFINSFEENLIKLWKFFKNSSKRL